MVGLKVVHGLQLALHLPEGSEIRCQIFYSVDTDDLKGDDGWKKIIDLLKKHYSKDGKSLGILPEGQIRVLINISCVMINTKSE